MRSRIFTGDMLASLQSSLGDVNEACALPSSLYTSEAFFEFEKEAIFARDWLCLGREDQIPRPGDYRTVEIIDEPLLMVRDKEGAIRVMSAVCQHRGMVLAEGAGNCQRFRCPYHHWVYGLDGRLMGAPEMEQAVNGTRASLERRLREELGQRTTPTTLQNTLLGESGTSAVSGALTKTLTHMPSSLSAASLRPIRMPIGTPTTIASTMPARKLRRVNQAASRKVSLGTSSTSAASTPDSGGNIRIRSSWPTSSHTAAQSSSDAIIGIRQPNTVMACASASRHREALSDAAIQRRRTEIRAVALDCHAAFCGSQ